MPKLHLFIHRTGEQRQLLTPDTCVNTAGEQSSTLNQFLLLLFLFPMVPWLWEAA